MNTVTMNKTSRRLPSIDWIALAVGVIGLGLSRVHGPMWGSWTGLLGLAVFGPPLLRELGLLNDDDEYARSIRWRAGFHAVLVVAVLVFLNKALYPLIAAHPDAMARKVYFFPVDYLRQSLVLVFLISYLIQYWGAPRGVFRIVLGVAGLTLVEMMSALPYHEADRLAISFAALVNVAILVGVAFFTHWKPKPGGYFLLSSGLVLVLFVINTFIRVVPEQNLETQLSMGQAVLTLTLVFFPTGLSLLKADNESRAL